MFVTDLVGDEFRNWKKGDKVVITSPTGSGKSTFILRSLLPYAIEQGKHIVYICNRKILNDQFAVESRKQLENILGTSELTEDEAHSIHVTTYQHCETVRTFPYFSILPDLPYMTRKQRVLAEIKGELPQSINLSPEKILYYVFDEAHYFLSDALFNPNTNYWREIKPYESAFSFITNAIDYVATPQSEIILYTLETDYSYVRAKYFNKFQDLTETIAGTSDKWLIFISNENDGIDLAARLDERGIAAAYLSSQTRHKKDSRGYQEFLNIVEQQRFSCQVLISTAVMDCGVSITDPELRNIVIDQPDKTEFLQMLGRRRVSENETITLYIKYLTPKNIDSLRARCEKNLHFMTDFYRLNEVGYDKKRNSTATDDGMEARSELPADTINRTVKEVLSGNNSALVYNKDNVTRANWSTTGPYADPRYSKSSPDILREYKMSSTAFIYILYMLKGYMDTLEVYRTKEDPLFYLKEQLSWLGKTYSVQNWVGYAERMQALRGFLEEYRSSGDKITSDQQPDFRQRCLNLILALPMPVKAIRKDISRFKKGTTPGMKKLNETFAEIGLPHRIVSKQAASGDRKSFWYIK